MTLAHKLQTSCPGTPQTQAGMLTGASQLAALEVDSHRPLQKNRCSLVSCTAISPSAGIPAFIWQSAVSLYQGAGAPREGRPVALCSHLERPRTGSVRPTTGRLRPTGSETYQELTFEDRHSKALQSHVVIWDRIMLQFSPGHDESGWPVAAPVEHARARAGSPNGI